MLRFQRSVGLALAVWLLACSPSPNPVAAFLDGAECQFESEDQRVVIESALQDMLTLSSDALKTRRYRDYQMNENAWTAVELIHHYFVPASGASRLEEASFYHDVGDPSARRSIQGHLDALRAGSRE